MFALERLRAIHAVSVHGSIAQAAAALHLTPSGVSQQLAKLERETGHQLLEPHGRGVRLTDAGQVLAAHAERVLSQLAVARADLDGLHDEVAGPLRIAAFCTALRGIVPGALAALRRRHPRLSVTVAEAEPEDALPGLVQGDLDVALIESWQNLPTVFPAQVTNRPLGTDVVDLALPERHPLANRSVVGLHELGDTQWASWTVGSTCHQWLVQTLRAQHVEPEITCTAAGYPAQLALVAANLVAALVPRLAREAPPNGVRMVATRPVLRREISVAWHVDADRPAVLACVDALHRSAEAVCPAAA